MKHPILKWLSVIAAIALLFCCRVKVSPTVSVPPENIRYAGVRSSAYGIEPFPAPVGWRTAVMGIRDRVAPAAAPCALWIVGTREDALTCRLEFPHDGSGPEHVAFSDVDRHEPYLAFFDAAGIKVFLQVEPMHADVPLLIDLVLTRYAAHPSVIGFGVDVEWFREADNPEWGMKVDDDTARLWEERVKRHHPSFRLFLKHWDRDWMPLRYRGDIVFVSDSQMLESCERMADEFSDYWSTFFSPNTVFFQVGYPSDRGWWSKLSDPPRDIGQAIAKRISQPCGLFWVDFTLRELYPSI